MVRLLKKQIAKFRKDESGATMIEYSVLIGLITVAIIAAILVVGNWVGTQWNTLSTTL